MAVSRTRRVAVIGAGASGILTAAHLMTFGLETQVFERNAGPGGVWLYDDRTAPCPSFPCMKPSTADAPTSGGRTDEEIALRRAPPGPCYKNLRTNVPTQLMAVSLLEVPLSTPEYQPHTAVLDYLQRIAAKSGVNSVTTYGALVEEVRKVGAQWTVRWSMRRKREDSDDDAVAEEVHYSKNFDAVVVASGHYHAPRVPDIPGLSRLRERFPARVMHSKQYRRPESFKEKTVLIIGGGVSSVDIAKDMDSARHIYQSTRGSSFDLDARMLPANASRVKQVVSFQLDDDDGDDDGDDNQAPSSLLDDNKPLPVSAILSGSGSGSDEDQPPLRGIDAVLLCTGYHISLPFLGAYHADATRAADADGTVLVTDGTQVHNLHRDMFYMPDPTLAFVGLPHHTFTHSVFEFQALGVAHVFAGVAALPSEEEMRAAYRRKMEAVGPGVMFHSLQNCEEEYVGDLVAWMNRGRAEAGGGGIPLIKGFSEAWYVAKEALRLRYREQSDTGNFL